MMQETIRMLIDGQHLTVDQAHAVMNTMIARRGHTGLRDKVPPMARGHSSRCRWLDDRSP